MPRTSPKFDFSDVDWRMSDRAIKKQLGCSLGLVAQKRRQLGKQPPQFYHLWCLTLDWSQTNDILVATTGRTPTAIAHWRRQAKKHTLKDYVADYGELVFAHLVKNQVQARLKAYQKPKPKYKTRVNYADVDWSQPLNVIAKQLGINISSVSRMRRKVLDLCHRSNLDRYGLADDERILLSLYRNLEPQARQELLERLMPALPVTPFSNNSPL